MKKSTAVLAATLLLAAASGPAWAAPKERKHPPQTLTHPGPGKASKTPPQRVGKPKGMKEKAAPPASTVPLPPPKPAKKHWWKFW